MKLKNKLAPGTILVSGVFLCSIFARSVGRGSRFVKIEGSENLVVTEVLCDYEISEPFYYDIL